MVLNAKSGKVAVSAPKETERGCLLEIVTFGFLERGVGKRRTFYAWNDGWSFSKDSGARRNSPWNAFFLIFIN